MDAPDPAVLREYTLLADGSRGILIGPHGDMTWGCFPRWDSDPVFARLLGAEGFYCVRPRDRHVWGGYYEEGSLIWRNRWLSDSSTVECREALSYPGNPDRAVILRRLTALDGDTAVSVDLVPRRSFGAGAPTRVNRDDRGGWTARLGELYLRWSGAAGARYDSRSASFRATPVLRQGEQLDLVLEVSTTPLDDEPPRPDVEWQATEQAWRSTVPPLDGRLARRDIRQACAVLRGLTSPTGAMVAAVTTSLPERAGGNRDFDYRYAWVRDQCYVGQAAAVADVPGLLDDAVRYVGERLHADGPKLRPAYTVTGERVPPQRGVDVPGYPGSPTVLIGNQAGAQFQLDIFGEALLLLAAAAGRDRLDGDGWRAAEIAADAIAARYDEPDAGIWETEPRRYAHSRLVCAAGLRRVASVAAPSATTSRWTALADRLLADTAGTCAHPSGRWQRAPDDARGDAALLVPQIRGLLTPDDPRAAASRHYVETELSEDGYVYRYPVDDQPLGVGEGAFLLCGYWLSMALLQAGETEKARAYFERSRSACGPAGLFTEEFDVGQRQLRGNLPQAFVHALMLENASLLSQR